MNGRPRTDGVAFTVHVLAYLVVALIDTWVDVLALTFVGVLVKVVIIGATALVCDTVTCADLCCVPCAAVSVRVIVRAVDDVLAGTEIVLLLVVHGTAAGRPAIASDDANRHEVAPVVLIVNVTVPPLPAIDVGVAVNRLIDRLVADAGTASAAPATPTATTAPAMRRTGRVERMRRPSDDAGEMHASDHKRRFHPLRVSRARYRRTIATKPQGTITA